MFKAKLRPRPDLGRQSLRADVASGWRGILPLVFSRRGNYGSHQVRAHRLSTARSPHPASSREQEQAAKARDFDQTLAAIAGHTDAYAALLANVSDGDFRTEIEMFGSKTTRGAFIVNLVLCGCAAYRTQLFVYLKACGREDLSTMNLWAGVDAPAAV